MPISVRRRDDARLTVIRARGELREPDVMESLRAAIEQNALPAGARRVAIFGPDVRVARMDIPAQHRIQDLILEHEARRPEGPGFRSALVVASSALLPSARLFKALYDLRGHPLVRVEVFEEEQAALAWLGCPPDLLD